VHNTKVPGEPIAKSLLSSYTPGRGKIDPRNVNKLAGKSYEDSDYTIMIAIVH